MKHDVSIVALQEPSINSFNNTIVSRDWVTIYPSTHCANPGKTCTLTLIRSIIITDSWEQVDFPSGDVTVVTIKGDWGKLTIFNIYIEGNSNDTISLLKQFHRSRPDVVGNLNELLAHTLCHWLSERG
jgi:hypothetical protein